MIRVRAFTAETFSHYSPRARAFAIEHLALLRDLPQPLLAALLGRIVRYDFQFPAEQQNLELQFNFLRSMSRDEIRKLLAPFSAIRLDVGVEKLDVVNHPEKYTERMGAWLWASHQLDAYRDAGLAYEERLATVLKGQTPTVPRFTIVVVGHGVERTNRMLFRQLRPRGTSFREIQPAGALSSLHTFVKMRAQQKPERYAHWYIDGGEAQPGYGPDDCITVMSYEELGPSAAKMLGLMSTFAGTASQQGEAGPEAVQSYMASLGAEELGLAKPDGDRVLQDFQASIFTAGAGTQVFSTTFVQWTAREVLRRAEPLTLLARFRPRQHFTSMEEMLGRNPLHQATDPEGSLIDADMGAFYTWINQSRLAGASDARFLVWFEDHGEAVAIGPSMAGGTTSTGPVQMQQVLQWMA